MGGWIWASRRSHRWICQIRWSFRRIANAASAFMGLGDLYFDCGEPLMYFYILVPSFIYPKYQTSPYIGPIYHTNKNQPSCTHITNTGIHHASPPSAPMSSFIYMVIFSIAWTAMVFERSVTSLDVQSKGLPPKWPYEPWDHFMFFAKKWVWPSNYQPDHQILGYTQFPFFCMTDEFLFV